MQERSRFRTISVAVAAVSAVIFGTATAGASPVARVAASSQIGSAPDCRFQPHFPPRVAVGQDIVGVVGTLTITGRGCRHYYVVGTVLIHETDRHNYGWLNPYTTDNETISAANLRPGRYRTTASSCLANNANGQRLTCAVGPASSIMKFAAKARLVGHRTGDTITFHARALKYQAYTGFVRHTAVVAIQRRIPSTHAWRTIHRAKCRAKTGYTWRYTHRNPASYRAVAAPTAATFAATSVTIRR